MAPPKIPFVRGKYEGIGWSIFLILLGIFLAVPESWVPDGIGRLLIGIVLLAYWAAGRLKQFNVSWVFLVVSVILILSGIGKIAGWAVSLMPFALIVIGLIVLYRSLHSEK
jgi:hypothetical protein